MIRFTGIPNNTRLGRLLRLPLRLIPATLTVRILQGPLRGARWIAGAEIAACWLGTYEAEKALRATKTVPPGWVCYDVGANAGYYSLLLSRCVGSEGRVIAFEPLPRNSVLLERHLRLNGCTNVLVRGVAVSDRAGLQQFEEDAGPSFGHLSPTGCLTVSAIRIDDAVKASDIPPPQFIKMDIEGGEAAALRGAEETLRRCRPVIFLATHGDTVRRECLDLLARIGYEVERISASDPDEFLCAMPGTLPSLP